MLPNGIVDDDKIKKLIFKFMSPLRGGVQSGIENMNFELTVMNDPTNRDIHRNWSVRTKQSCQRWRHAIHRGDRNLDKFCRRNTHNSARRGRQFSCPIQFDLGKHSVARSATIFGHCRQRRHWNTRTSFLGWQAKPKWYPIRRVTAGIQRREKSWYGYEIDFDSTTLFDQGWLKWFVLDGY